MKGGVFFGGRVFLLGSVFALPPVFPSSLNFWGGGGSLRSVFHFGLKMKRSVGPRYWAPRPSDTEGHKPTTKGLIPLVEG